MAGKPTAEVKRLKDQRLRLTTKQIETMDERDAALAEVARLRALAEMVAALEVVRKHGGQEMYLRHDTLDVQSVRDLARKLTAQG